MGWAGTQHQRRKTNGVGQKWPRSTWHREGAPSRSPPFPWVWQNPFQCISLFSAHSLFSVKEMTHTCAHACTQSRAFYCEKSEAGGRKGPTGTAPAQVSWARGLRAREGKCCNPLRDKQRADVTGTVVMATLQKMPEQTAKATARTPRAVGLRLGGTVGTGSRLRCSGQSSAEARLRPQG